MSVPPAATPAQNPGLGAKPPFPEQFRDPGCRESLRGGVVNAPWWNGSLVVQRVLAPQPASPFLPLSLSNVPLSPPTQVVDGLALEAATLLAGDQGWVVWLGRCRRVRDSLGDRLLGLSRLLPVS